MYEALARIDHRLVGSAFGEMKSLDDSSISNGEITS
jgi:hypothetical protein